MARSSSLRIHLFGPSGLLVREAPSRAPPDIQLPGLELRLQPLAGRVGELGISHDLLYFVLREVTAHVGVIHNLFEARSVANAVDGVLEGFSSRADRLEPVTSHSQEDRLVPAMSANPSPLAPCLITI